MLINIKIIQTITKFLKGKNQKIISCQFGYRRIVFFGQMLAYCSNGNPIKQRAYPVIYQNFKGNLNIDDLANRIRKDRINASKGKLLDTCIGCNLVKDEYKNEKNKKYPHLEHVLFSDWCMCNSKCIYCDSWKATKIDGENISMINGATDSYEIMPIIEMLIKKRMINKDTIIGFAGGEPTIYRQFEQALDYFLNFGIKRIEVYSNIIKYSEQIKRGLELGVVELTVSVDAGTSQIHEMVKGVKSYNIVYENLKKYLSYAHNPGLIISKYVIVPNINDSEDEIREWIMKSKEIGIKKLVINADNRIFEKEYNSDLIKKLNDLTIFFEKTAKKYDMEIDIASNLRFAEKIDII